MTLDLGASIIAILCLLVMSAFFSGSETALTATSRARINELERARRASNSRCSFRERLIGTLLSATPGNYAARPPWSSSRCSATAAR
jgi:Mg2+/Co2+ transporter CorB